jgi:heme/copper-type cytochrome/quinol oxidase subunit 2
MSLFVLIAIVVVVLLIVIGIPLYFIRRASRARRAKNPQDGSC